MWMTSLHFPGAINPFAVRLIFTARHHVLRNSVKMMTVWQNLKQSILVRFVFWLPSKY